MELMQMAIASSLFTVTVIIWVMAYFALRKKAVPGAKPFAALCMVTSIYTFGYCMEILSPTLEQVNFWSKVQYIGLPFLPTYWVLVAKDFCKIEIKYKGSFYAFIFIMPALTTLFRLTSDWTHLQYGAMKMVSNGYFQVLDFVRGPWYYIHYVFLFICAFYAMVCYWRIHVRALGYLKKQSLLLIIGSATPIVAAALNSVMVFPLKLDWGPFFVFANYILFVIGIFRYNLMNILPLARERIFDWIQDGVLVFDMQLNVVDYNRIAAELFPEMTREALGTPMQDMLVRHETFSSLIRSWHATLGPTFDSGERKRNQAPNFDFSMPDLESGLNRNYFCRLSELYDRGELVGFSALISDVTERTEIMNKLEHAAQTDGLTQLMNRSYFIECVEHRVKDRRNMGHDMSLIIFDVDHFKLINDRFGHVAGDEVLREISRRAAGYLREEDLLGRYGGEEFILFLPRTGQSDAIQIAERIRCAFSDQTIMWENVEMGVTASFGITTLKWTEDLGTDLDFDNFVKCADEALYKAKAEGRNKVIGFEFKFSK